MHAFVLHLTRASGRRENARRLRDQCGPAGEIWPAVDGSSISSSELAGAVGSHLFEPAYPFGLKTGEIGCFLSHRQIWAEIQNRKIDAALIVEDDAGIEPEAFTDALDLARQHIEELGYIQFQTRAAEGRKTLIDKAGTCVLTVPVIGGLRTTAQMVSRRAAAHLLRLSEVIDRPVDTFVQSHWHTGLRPAAIHPSGVGDIADRLDGSTIQTGRKPFFERLRREVVRSRYRRAAARLSHRSAAPSGGGFGDA